MIIALDVEGTLVSNAVSQFPRPGLLDFLDECQRLADRVVIYTSVSESRFRAMAAELARRGEAPEWFPFVDFVDWSGRYKRLHAVDGSDGSNVVLVDDMEAYIHPDDADRWVRIPAFEAPYPATDRALEAVIREIRSRSLGGGKTSVK